MSTTTLKCTCLCKSAKHDIPIASTDLPLKLTCCHCNSCRHFTGVLTLTVAVLPEIYTPSPDLLAKLTTYDFSPRITDYFCLTCGTHMLFHVKQGEQTPNSNGYWAVHTGILNQVDGFLEPDAHWFVGDTVDSGFAYVLPSVRGKHIPRYAGFKEKSDLLPLHWKSEEVAYFTGLPSDKLHCHCKCGGVNFWIARPSKDSRQAPNHLSMALQDNGTRYPASICVCDSCRLDAGMEWSAWAFIPTSSIALDSAGKVPVTLPFGSLQEYRSRHDVSRYHCCTCGASAFHQRDDRWSAGLVCVAGGLMNAAEGARAESWLEWDTTGIGHKEDALSRAKELTEAVEAGVAAWGRMKQEQRQDGR